VLKQAYINFYATQVSLLREPSNVIGNRSHLPKTDGQGRMTRLALSNSFASSLRRVPSSSS